MTSGSPSTLRTGCLLGDIEDLQQLFLQHALQFGDVANLLAVDFRAKRLQHRRGGGGAQVGADEGGFEFVESVAIDFLADGNHVFDSLAQAFTRARDRLLSCDPENSVFPRYCQIGFES